MSVIWSGITEEGAVVPVQVTAEGKVVAVGDGPEGNYLPITGGELTGDLSVDGDITVTGAAAFAGSVDIGNLDFSLTTSSGGELRPAGILSLQRPASTILNAEFISAFLGDQQTFRVEVGGKVLLAGDIDCGNTGANAEGGKPGVYLDASAGRVYCIRQSEGKVFSAYNNGVKGIEFMSSGNASFAGDLSANSATFANGACGFTAAGEIFFTSRGSRYKLFVSNGMVQAEAYTRQMELKEKAEQFIADKRETKPASPQDEVTTDNDNA